MGRYYSYLSNSYIVLNTPKTPPEKTLWYLLNQQKLINVCKVCGYKNYFTYGEFTVITPGYRFIILKL